MKLKYENKMSSRYFCPEDPRPSQKPKQEAIAIAGERERGERSELDQKLSSLFLYQQSRDQRHRPNQSNQRDRRVSSSRDQVLYQSHIVPSISVRKSGS